MKTVENPICDACGIVITDPSNGFIIMGTCILPQHFRTGEN